eukprot:COSAG03_NODE_726_length_6073_cov_7.166388_4_plen_87_part_00
MLLWRRGGHHPERERELQPSTTHPRVTGGSLWNRCLTLSRLKDRAARAEKSRIRMGAAARAVQDCKDSHLVYAPLLLTSTKEVASS